MKFNFPKIRFFVFAIVTASCLTTLYYLKDWGLKSMTESNNSEKNLTEKYLVDIESYRKNVEESLKKPTSWLAVVGLVWLKEKNNTVGSNLDTAVRLPTSAPSLLGQIVYEPDSKPFIRFVETNGVTLNDKPVKSDETYTLLDDSDQNMTKINVGTVSFHTIKRKNGIGVRIRDSNAPTRLNFKGRTWFAPNEKFLIEADWVAFSEPKKILVPDVIGNQNEELSPGVAKFELDGQMVELTPVSDGDDLFFIFRDQSSGKETYGAARFLYAEKPIDGKVILDFNRAVNPPCAFTNFATCPLPPKENILPVAIRAGELFDGPKH